ncbi:hypothetical protein RFI_06182 [Reticulomyxa filosa]|uniref:Uncharacterized protein n=1 Tax=Reticulomyxa filosa TaxID=46433 RepID=X6NYM1_RETFI|nr:hypothetical protein RFI_06182 [Reticulomyxa filosa]|eukprot:ETO30934.1 hypothetical protein RFI_06182 [Reticulomyxa filosa]
MDRHILKGLIPKEPHQIKFKRLLKARLATIQKEGQCESANERKQDTATSSSLSCGKALCNSHNYYVTQRQWRSFINKDAPMNKFGYRDEPADGGNKHWFNFQFVAFAVEPNTKEFELKKIVLSEECSGITFHAFNKPYPEFGVTEEIIIMEPPLVLPARFTIKGQNGLFFMRSDTSNFWGFRIRETFWTKVTHWLIPNTYFFVTQNATKKESFLQIDRPFVKSGFSNGPTNDPLCYPFHFVAFAKNEKPIFGRSDDLKSLNICNTEFWGFSKPTEDFIDEIIVLANKQDRLWLIPGLIYHIYKEQIPDNWSQKDSFYTRIRSDLVPNVYLHVSHSDKQSSFVQMHHPCLEFGFSHINKESNTGHWQPFHWIAFDKKPPLLTNVKRIYCVSVLNSIRTKGHTSLCVDEGVNVEFWAFNEKINGEDDMHEVMIWGNDKKLWICGAEFAKDSDRRQKQWNWSFVVCNTIPTIESTFVKNNVKAWRFNNKKSSEIIFRAYSFH